MPIFIDFITFFTIWSLSKLQWKFSEILILQGGKKRQQYKYSDICGVKTYISYFSSLELKLFLIYRQEYQKKKLQK